MEIIEQEKLSLSRSCIEHSYSDDHFIPGGFTTMRQSEHIQRITRIPPVHRATRFDILQQPRRIVN